MFTNVYVHSFSHTHIHILFLLRVRVHVYAHVHVTHMQSGTKTKTTLGEIQVTFVHAYTHMYNTLLTWHAYAHTRIYVYIHICTYMHTLTCTHTLLTWHAYAHTRSLEPKRTKRSVKYKSHSHMHTRTCTHTLITWHAYAHTRTYVYENVQHMHIHALSHMYIYLTNVACIRSHTQSRKKVQKNLRDTQTTHQEGKIKSTTHQEGKIKSNTHKESVVKREQKPLTALNRLQTSVIDPDSDSDSDSAVLNQAITSDSVRAHVEGPSDKTHHTRKASGQRQHVQIDNGGEAHKIRGKEAHRVRGKLKDLSVTEIQRVWRGHRARSFYRVLTSIDDLSGAYHVCVCMDTVHGCFIEF
jgi:hypothetical protein